MRIIPFFYLSYDKNGLEVQTKSETNAKGETKTKVLKVSRKREENFYEFFEFQ